MQVERRAVGTPMSQLVHRYISGRVRRGEIVAGSVGNHWSALLVLVETYGSRPPERMGVADIERWLEARSSLMASSRVSQLSTVRNFCRWLVREKVIRQNPVDELTHKPRRPRTEPRALDVDAVGAVLAVAPDARARAIVWLMVGLGLRCVEVSRLRVEDWSRRDGLLRVVGKAGHEREVPVTAEVSSALAIYLAECPATSGPFIRNSRAMHRPVRAATISHLLTTWMFEAQVKGCIRDGISAHALRHTCASDVLDECHDLRVVQQLLGHQMLSSTAIYLRRASVTAMREAMSGRTYQPPTSAA